MKAFILALTAVVLGAACTGDRPSSPPTETPGGAETTCDEMPGPVPEGFVLQRTREVPGEDHVATRREFEAPDGRLLVYLLGVAGEVGEGSAIVEGVALRDGTPATLLGGGANWVLTWAEAPPCRQMSVVGNGFTRSGFAEVMVEAGLLGRGG